MNLSIAIPDVPPATLPGCTCWIPRNTGWASKKFMELRAAKPARQGGKDPVVDAARERVEFEATIHQGIQDGRIHSIIQPMMADHMHREGLRFIEELKLAR